METSGIYSLCNELGHHAISLNAILANRVKGDFSVDTKVAINGLIVDFLKIWGGIKKR